MKWLLRLKKIEIVHEVGATETTKRVSVVSVAPALALMRKKGSDSPASNDSVILETANLDHDYFEQQSIAAMTGMEINAFMARLERFTVKGVTHTEGNALAERLVTRDHELDDRRLCLECMHLAGYSGMWSCRNWQQAGVAVKVRAAGLSGDLVFLLQRCEGFRA